MRGTEERIKLVKQRAMHLHHRREKRVLGALFTLCLTLSIALVRTFALLAGNQQGASVQEMFGSTLMFEDVGAYVLVGIISFTAAVIITVLGLRHRRKEEMSRKDNSQAKNLHSAEDVKNEKI